MEHINKDTFKQAIQTGVVVVDFYADWCGPCKMLTPVLEALSLEIPDVHFYKVNVDNDKKLALSYDILSIPVLLLFKDGELVGKTQGFSPKEMIKTFIDKAQK